MREKVAAKPFQVCEYFFTHLSSEKDREYLSRGPGMFSAPLHLRSLLLLLTPPLILNRFVTRWNMMAGEVHAWAQSRGPSIVKLQA